MPAAIDWVRPSFYLAGAAMLALVAGFSLNLGWAGLFWPWPHGRLSFQFVVDPGRARRRQHLHRRQPELARRAAGGEIALLIASAALSPT